MYRKNLEGNTKLLKMAKSGGKDWWKSFILVFCVPLVVKSVASVFLKRYEYENYNLLKINTTGK